VAAGIEPITIMETLRAGRDLLQEALEEVFALHFAEERVDLELQLELRLSLALRKLVEPLREAMKVGLDQLVGLGVVGLGVVDSASSISASSSAPVKSSSSPSSPSVASPLSSSGCSSSPVLDRRWCRLVRARTRDRSCRYAHVRHPLWRAMRRAATDPVKTKPPLDASHDTAL